MKVLIAPDKFKGSLTTQQVCDAVASGLTEYDSSIIIKCIPLADGGEGTSSLLTSFNNGKVIRAEVSDPLFRKITAHYGITNDGKTAFIEVAAASGLTLLKEAERNPHYTTTFGTCELIRHALGQGVERLVIGLGGSATNDAGIGAAAALGVQFFDKNNINLRPIGENLHKITSIDLSHVHPRVRSVQSIILCDVTNPLHGANGAAYVFAPQKGADTVTLLDEGLKNIETILASLGYSCDYRGAGAAGGFSVMMKVLMNTELHRGFDFISRFTNLEREVKEADVVITGEGKIDEQTLSGKVVMGVAALAKKYHKPTLAVAGMNCLQAGAFEEIGLAGIVALVNEEVTPPEAMRSAFNLLKNRVKTHLVPMLKSL